MNDLQYQILDELYFVTPFAELKQQTDLDKEELIVELRNMAEAGWIKTFYPGPDQEIQFDSAVWEKMAEQCLFLATKAGLLIHNGR